MKQEAKDLGKGFVLSMLVFAMILLFIAVIYAARYFSAESRGKVVMEENVTSGRAQEFSYNVFFDQCAAIQGYTIALNAQQDALKVAPMVPDDERSRINTNIAAIKAQRGRAIAQYNVDARKVSTMARFKDSGLPDYINANSENVTCQK